MTSRTALAVLLALGPLMGCKAPPDAPPPPPTISSAPPLSSKAAVTMTTSLVPSDTIPTSKGDLVIAPIHHASVAFRWAGKLVYVDPWTPMENLPKADVVFLTDIHPDHLDDATLAKVKGDHTIVVGPPAVAEKTHVDVVMKNGESKDVDGIGVEAVPMYNLVRGPTKDTRYHDKGRGNGYVLTFGDKRVYLSGDTECTPEMKALKNVDVAFVCMNLPYTETAEEAAQCTLAFEPKIVFPYHWEQKDPSLPPQKPEDFKAKVSAKNPSIDVRIRNWYPGGP